MTGAPPREPFGALPDGTPVERVRLVGRDGFEAAIITYGAAVQALLVPDRSGRVDDVALGHDDLAGYLARRRCFGATVGRYANRIAGAGFVLDGVRHALEANDGPNTLHSGPDGFDRRPWRIAALGGGEAPFVTLALDSPDGDGGFPGALAARVTYRVEGTALAIDLEATCDRPTVVNLTHHGYLNLRGRADPGSVLDHVLGVAAERYLPVGPGSIPLDPAPVAGTPFDFRVPTPLGARIRDADPQLLRALGYDHAFCLDGGRTDAPRPAARLVHPASGRALALETDQPGLQVYTANSLDGSDAGKGGRPYRQTDAVALEAQAWPDTPNRPDFPSARLDPGATYRNRIVLRFSVEP